MYYCGVDIGGTKIAIVISDKNFNILKKISFFTNTDADPHDIMDEIISKIEGLLNFLSIDRKKLLGIGISCGGPLDSQDGVIINPPNLPKWVNIKIKSYFEERLKVSTYLLNDANACAVAEWKLGAGRGCDDIIFLTFGTGMGAGMILNGRLYEGKAGQAGEVGHIRIAKNGSYAYGKYGSFESYCSGNGIRNLALNKLEEKSIQGADNTLLLTYDKHEINAELIFDLADKGDKFCREVINISAEKLGLGLSILIDILNPERIIIGSIYRRQEAYFKDIVNKVIKEEALEINRKSCQIVPSALGENLGDYAALITALGKY